MTTTTITKVTKEHGKVAKDHGRAMKTAWALAGSLLLGWALIAQAPPARIVSLVPAATEILFAIGAGPRVVGVSSYDHEPAEVDRLPRVGALVDPDLERILGLRPDLVVIYGSQRDLRRQLDRAGAPVFGYTHGGLREVTATIRSLGDRTGTAARAREVAAAIERDLAAIASRVAGRPRPRTLLVFGREPGTLRNMYASGGTGFLHDMLEAAGGANVFADQKRESVQAGAETLLTAAPEVVLEIRAGPEPVDLTAWQSLPAIPAVRRKRLVVLTGSDLVTPGPRVAAATERLARALHPEVF
jgi:iron complex transport system substrate-binding protein